MTKTDFNFDRFNLSDENPNSNVKYLLIQNFLKKFINPLYSPGNYWYYYCSGRNMKL